MPQKKYSTKANNNNIQKSEGSKGAKASRKPRELQQKRKKENLRKCSKRYTDKSKRMLKQHKKHGDDLREQDYFEKANAEKGHGKCVDLTAARKEEEESSTKSEQALEESRLEELDMSLVSKCVDQPAAREEKKEDSDTAMTTQVTSIGDIGPYQAPGRRVREVSYQPGSETLLSGLYRTDGGPNHYAM
ncbi:hypothetical protein BGY98DRAFT_932961 [Russula aff. rugulosa BPL654]|nr:hypothetical protein BGY98DRAFT_932961 [Russula aff. rugulosa BPL654]